MDAATVYVLVARTLSSLAMDAGTVDVLAARMLSSWGHGGCDSGRAGNTDVIILRPCMLRHWMCW